MEYQQALEALEGALKFGIDPSLEPIRQMCAALGNPQESYTCVQVAGTNGKSSVSRMTAALLGACGLKTALYTSPELVRYPERMELCGRVVSDQRFADAVEAALGAAQRRGIQATEFELLTAGALWLFAQEGVEVAVLECGLGGRWDATSVCSPRVAVITGIALDHTHILGNTLEAIAAEKAAIIKPGCTAVLAPQLAARPVFEQRICEVGAHLLEVDPAMGEELAPALAHMPSYQQGNAAVAYTAARSLVESLGLEDARRALVSLQIPGRFETLRERPLLLIDAAHNPQSAQVLAREVECRFPRLEERPVLLVGVLADKDVEGVVGTLAPLFERIVCTASKSPRSIAATELAGLVARANPAASVQAVPSIPEALQLLAACDVIASGSITVAGEVKGCWLDGCPKPE
ncbi:MAG: bifunctional folylpolyglutamate synthase/dihydrofolate synthase [Coriobacteriales bacterium]